MNIHEQINKLNTLIDLETDRGKRNLMRHQLRNLEYRLNQLNKRS